MVLVLGTVLKMEEEHDGGDGVEADGVAVASKKRAREILAARRCPSKNPLVRLQGPGDWGFYRRTIVATGMMASSAHRY
jgi:hypothetical protein